ncbi:MAG: sugar phosphate isomerase/epimerase [Thaumarchaeota archaeon]|nr:sugar phosphate isomerase/epimerase [Nitrososphaerota archaeon]
MSFKYSITLSSFRGMERIGTTLERLERQGYEAVEIAGEPQNTDLDELNGIIRSYKISVCGVTGMWGRKSPRNSMRRMLSLDGDVRKHAEKYVRGCIDMCRELGGHEFNVCLFADEDHGLPDPNHMTSPQAQKLAIIERAIPLLSDLAGYASERGVDLLIEPLNRFSTPYCTTAADAIGIVQNIGWENAGVLLDTFHMNIEEGSIEHAIQDAGDFLKHTHFAENNRRMPGSGHIDFGGILGALQGAGYGGYISFEPQLDDKDYMSSTLEGLLFLKRLECELPSKEMRKEVNPY